MKELKFRSRNILRSVLLIALFISVQTSVYAQIFNHISPRDGISSGYINSITEDSNGFLWIGTTNGLDKYDGYDIVNYQPANDDSTSLLGDVFELIEYADGQFLVGHEHGVDVFDPGTEIFNSIGIPDSIPPIKMAMDILVDDNNMLWVNALGGLYRVDLSTLSESVSEATYFPFPATTEEDIQGRTLHFDDSGVFWLGTSVGLLTFNTQTDTYIELPEMDDPAKEVLSSVIWKIFEDSAGRILFAADSGLAIKYPDEKKLSRVEDLGDYNEDDLRIAGFQTIDEDKEGVIWLGTASFGVIKWNIETGLVEYIKPETDNEDSIQSEDIHYIYLSRSGDVWFGYHSKGLSMMFDRSWNYDIVLPFPDLEPKSPFNDVTWIDEDEDGTLWLTTARGIAVLAPGKSDATIALADSSMEFSSISRSDSVLFGIVFTEQYEYETYVFDKETSIFSIIENPFESRLSTPFIFQKDGVVYLSNQSSSLLMFDIQSRKFTQKEVPAIEEGIEADSTANIPNLVIPVIDMQGNIFVVKLTLDIVSRQIDWENFIYDDELGEFTVSPINTTENLGFSSMFIMSDLEAGLMYTVIRGRGLYQQNFITGSSEFKFESEAGVLAESNWAMLEDNEGFIWMDNSTGVMRLDPITESITYFELGIDKAETYGIPHQMSNGDILFPGSNGILRFNPEQLQEEDQINALFINSIQTGNETISLLYHTADDLKFESRNNNISFNYTGINYKDPTFTRYRYRLKGYNDEWIEVGAQRNVFIPNLPPNDYTFEVQAASRFGGFSGNIASASFTVMPPFWRTFPAYILYVLLLGGLLISVDRLQRRRVLTKERERNREKELKQAKEIEKAYEHLKAAQEQLVQQEKLASLGQLTAGIAHEIKNPLNFVNNFSDLSVELIEEAMEEIKSVRAYRDTPIPEGALDEISNILNDIESNLKTIHKHGTRADSIVKSMLQHSRGGSGSMESEHLNELVQEYVNLTFHGMRAGKNPINVDIDLQLDDSIGEVPLIAEDFSRVIVNLCNNAFDAMREKSIQNSKFKIENYSPKLTVRTIADNGKVSVEIEDNGPGISEEIRNKILQPFFTTKKGTEGTGLGLSITNDIIKAHGGTVSIESEKGTGTTFTITLNKQQS